MRALIDHLKLMVSQEKMKTVLVMIAGLGIERLVHMIYG
jgi:hypothetical protein